MQTSLVEEWIIALRKELDGHKGKMAIVFAIVTAAIVVVGMFWPKQFEASSVIFADEQNIIRPLLEGQAAVTGLASSSDRLTVARERMTSNTILEQVILDAGLVPNLDDKQAVNNLMRGIAGGLRLSDAGRNHIRISYRSKDPERAYLMASTFTNAFIRDSAQSKRAESRDAYTFIDNQVKTYKTQLQHAEDRLKEFRSQFTDGSEASVDARLTTLRTTMEEQTLELQVAKARRDELRNQLASESQFINQSYRADVYRERLNEAQSRLDTLRLSYQDTYPDIVALKYQIEDLNRAISDAENNRTPRDSRGASANPVYQQLRSELAEAEVMVKTLELRVESNRRLLSEEQDRSRRVAEHQAQLSELTRDYNVTRQLYEDLLERKERARMSMALDIEGQGITYRIKEPVVFPTGPVGLRFVHFFLAAPLLGVLIPIGLIVAYIQLDPRLRFSERLQEALPPGVPVLAVIPHVSNSQERRANRREWVMAVAFMALVMAAYAIVAVVRLAGVM